MTKKTKKKLIRYLVIPVISLLLLLFTGIAILLNVVFTPAKLTPIAERLLNENLEAEVQFESIELTFFSSFPHFELHIKNGNLQQKNDVMIGKDTLLSFVSCDASFNLRKLLFKEILDVKEVALVNPVIHGFIDSNGMRNFDILKEGKSTDTESNGEFHLKKILIRNLVIDNAVIDITDESTGFMSAANNLTLKIKAADTPDKMKLKLESVTEQLNFTYNKVPYIRDLRTALKADMVLDKQTKQLSFKNSALKLNEVDFVLDGVLMGNKEARNVTVDIQAALKVPSLNNLWHILPANITGTNDVEVEGQAKMTMNTKGIYGTGQLPVTTVDMSIEKGAVAYKNFPGKISLLETKAKAVLDFIDEKNALIAIEHLNIEATGLKANGSAMVTQAFTTPILQTNIEAALNLSKVKEVMPLPKGILLNGTVNLNAEAKGDVKKIMLSDFNSLDIEGDVVLKDLLVESASDTLHLEVAQGLISSHRDGTDKGFIKTKLSEVVLWYKNEHNINIRQAEAGMKRGRLSGAATPLSAKLLLAGLQYKSKQAETLSVNNFMANASVSSLDIKTLGATGNVSFKDLNIVSEKDTMDVSIAQGGVAFRRSPSDRMKADLELLAIKAGYKTDHSVVLQRAHVVLGKGKGQLQDARLKADATLEGLKYNNTTGDKVAAVNMVAHAFITPGQTWLTPAAITSTFTADSLYAVHGKNFVGIRKGSYDINLQHDSIQGWIPKGFVEFENILAYSPEMGLPLKLLQSKISFSDKGVALKDAHILFGKSDIYATGYISNLFAKKDQITKGKLKVQGKYIDANELMTAMQKGQAFYEKTFIATEEPADVMEALPETEKTIFALPKNMDLQLETSLDHVLFGTLDMRDIRGHLEMKDGHLDLKDFHLKTLAADLDTKIRYEAVDNKSARLLFSLDVRNIDMNNLHRLAPGMDTLMPMIKYFEGKAQFSVRGTGLLNENLDVDAGSVKGFAAIKAKDIMVLDNETFRDLAKTLMFKSKDKNTVDVLDVEMMLDNNRMEILPAHIEIDRYELAIGGLQNLDFTYDYHISVLKSPVPFKMGVDLKGDFDKYRISLSKAKYKFYFTDKKRLMEKADINIVNKKRFIQEKLNF